MAPKRPQDAHQIAKLRYEDLSLVDVEKLSQILSHGPRPSDNQESMTVKNYKTFTAEEIRQLPPTLAKQVAQNATARLASRLESFVDTSLFPNSSRLCQLHRPLHEELVHSIFKVVRHDVDHKMPRIIASIRRHLKPQGYLNTALQEMESIRAMWLSRSSAENLPDDTDLRKYKWEPQYDGCEACVLARIGGQPDIACCLLIFFIARMCKRSTQDPAGGDNRKPEHHLYEAWVRNLDSTGSAKERGYYLWMCRESGERIGEALRRSKHIKQADTIPDDQASQAILPVLEELEDIIAEIIVERGDIDKVNHSQPLKVTHTRVHSTSTTNSSAFTSSDASSGMSSGTIPSWVTSPSLLVPPLSIPSTSPTSPEYKEWPPSPSNDANESPYRGTYFPSYEDTINPPAQDSTTATTSHTSSTAESLLRPRFPSHTHNNSSVSDSTHSIPIRIDSGIITDADTDTDSTNANPFASIDTLNAQFVGESSSNSATADDNEDNAIRRLRASSNTSKMSIKRRPVPSSVYTTATAAPAPTVAGRVQEYCHGYGEPLVREDGDVSPVSPVSPVEEEYEDENHEWTGGDREQEKWNGRGAETWARDYRDLI